LFVRRPCGSNVRGPPVTSDVRGVGHMRRSDILVAPHVRPVFREHRPTKLVNFNLPANLKACPFESQIEPANT